VRAIIGHAHVHNTDLAILGGWRFG
jgi:hypothetical protein